jgi:hypothetical protein
VSLNFARLRQLFLFFCCLAGSRDESRLVLPPTPLHDIGGAFPRALFYCFFMYLYPLIVRPIEFRIVFASLALVALEAGQSRVSSSSCLRV